MTFLLTFVRFLAIALWVLVLARVLLSWVDPSGRSRLATYIIGFTEPILGTGPACAPIGRDDGLVGVPGPVPARPSHPLYLRVDRCPLAGPAGMISAASDALCGVAIPGAIGSVG